MNQLLQLKEKSEEKKRLENQLKKAEAELTGAKLKLKKLALQLKKESDDVQKLEMPGLSALFYSILGTKVEKLDKERQEYLSAKLKYNNCKNGIAELEALIERLKVQIEQAGSPETSYKKLLDEKKTVLALANDEKYLQYEKELEFLFQQKKEINEAIDAGERAMQGLAAAANLLRNAKGWGTFDMLGGGLIATAVKHSKIDDTERIIHQVQVDLQRFKRELSDIQLNKIPDLILHLDSFMTFADYFFDNLIFDWVVQSKILRSLNNCEQMHRQVSGILEHMKNTDQQITSKYRTTKTNFNNYIEQV